MNELYAKSKVARGGRRPTVVMIGPSRNPLGGQSTLVNTILRGEMSKFVHYVLLDVEHYGIENLWKRILISIGYWLQLLYILLIHRNVKLLHIHTSAGMAFFEKSVFAATGKLFGKKVIMHMHGGRFREIWNSAGTVKRFFIKHLISMNDILVVLADRWKNFYEQEVKCKCKIAVIHNAVDVEKAITKHNPECISFLFVGELRPEKGVLDLLNAYSALDIKPRTKTLLKLMGKNKGHKSIAEALNEISTPHKVEVLGSLTGRKKWEQFEMSDVFVLPSHSEDMPMVILEAMAFGLPIIATDVGCVSDLVLNENNGYLVMSNNVKELSERMQELVDNKNMRIQMGKASSKILKEKYSVSRLEKNLYNVYCNVIETGYIRDKII